MLPIIEPKAQAIARPATKLQYINALRGWAILSVIVVHNSNYGSTDLSHFSEVLNSLVNQGARGVQLFFVASAFTLFLSMSKRKQEKHPTRNFFIRRFFRIAPMYYLGIAFYTYWFTQVQPHPITPANILANLTFLHGLSPYWIHSLVPGGWSITVEMWFYALAPFLFTRIKTVDQAVRFIAVTMLVACLVSIVVTPLHVTPDKYDWLAFTFAFFPTQLPVFGFGILLYLLLSTSEQPKSLKPNTYLLAAGVAILVLATGFGDLLHRTGAASEGQHFWFSGAFVLLALGLSKHQPRLLVNPLINYIGEISFSLYLVHFAVLFGLEVLGHSDLIEPTRMVTALADFGLRYALVLAISVVLATISYRLIEVPFQNLGKRLIARLER
jgi:peptidoglycan/LPS O-acetylase OafA/YrhL